MATVAPQPVRLARSTKVVFGFASLGFIMINGIYSALLPIFYQDYMGLSASWIATASLIYAIWNAINDPLFGYITDNTRSRHGRRIPYLRFTAPFLALTFFLVWMTPANLGKTGVFWWMLVTMLLYDSCYTIIGLVYSALLPELSESDNERAQLQISSTLFGLLGFALGFIIPDLFRPKAGEPMELLPLRLALLVVGLVGMLLIISTTFKVKERPELSHGQEKVNFVVYLKETFSRRSAMILIAANFMRVLVVALVTGSIFYLADYVLQTNAILLLGVYFVPLVIGVSVSGFFRKRLGVLRAQQFSLVLGAIGLISVVFLPGNWLFLSIALAGFGLAGPEALTYVLFAQVIDEDELRIGQRREGAFFGTNALLTKPAQSLALALPPFLLEATRFITREANNGVVMIDQPASAILGIRLFSGLIPGIALLIAAAILIWFPLKGETLTAMKSEVLALHAAKEARYQAFQASENK
jgi:glycoside/pentoside/hexuronide:cation symporter, GPH family